jgi:hypothetical protein
MRELPQPIRQDILTMRSMSYEPGDVADFVHRRHNIDLSSGDII